MENKEIILGKTGHEKVDKALENLKKELEAAGQKVKLEDRDPASDGIFGLGACCSS